jgi:hypothetical protein
MDTKQIISWLALLFGEALIIAIFILFRGNLDDNVLVLNIVVASVIYGLFFVDILVPWIDFHDKSQRSVGSMGVRWFATWIYAIVAIAVMVAANIYSNWGFSTQLVVHGVLLFFLILGFLGFLHVSDKVVQVHQTETSNRDGITEMKKAIVRLKDKISVTADLPDTFVQRINLLDENLRFISPVANSETRELERAFINTINSIDIALTNYSLNEQHIENSLKQCERLYQNRKQVYSN